MALVRQAHIIDLSKIVHIYNEAILEGGNTADTTIYSLEEKVDWFKRVNDSKNGIYVVEEERIVVGYFYFTPWRNGRKSLDGVREVSFYIDRKFRGIGFGDLILSHLSQIAIKKNLSFLMAIILDQNLKSKKLLEKWGFEIAGALPGVVNFETEVRGQLILLKKLN